MPDCKFCAFEGEIDKVLNHMRKFHAGMSDAKL